MWRGGCPRPFRAKRADSHPPPPPFNKRSRPPPPSPPPPPPLQRSAAPPPLPPPTPRRSKGRQPPPPLHADHRVAHHRDCLAHRLGRRACVVLHHRAAHGDVRRRHALHAAECRVDGARAVHRSHAVDREDGG